MRRPTSIKYLALLLLIVLAGCKTKRQLADVYTVPAQPERVESSPLLTVSPPPPSFNQALIDSLTQKSVSFNTLSLRTKSDITLDGKQHDVTLNIRIKKDEAIWLSATAIAGLELARILITPDSVKIINRAGKEYLKKPFSYIHEFSGKDISFGTIQALITGNPVPGFLNNQSILTQKNELRFLSGSSGQLAFSTIFNPVYKLVQTTIQNDIAKQVLIASYRDFSSESGQMLATSVDIRSSSGVNSIVLSMNYSKIIVNAVLEMPFNIPDRFTVINE